MRVFECLSYANEPDYLLGEGAREVRGSCGSGIMASTHCEPPLDHEMFRHQRAILRNIDFEPKHDRRCGCLNAQVIQTSQMIYSGRVRWRCVARVRLGLGLKLIENHPQTMKCFVISDLEKYRFQTKI